MYSIQIFKKGVDFLGIKDLEIMRHILDNNFINIKWLQAEEERKKRIEDWNNRFKVPQGLSKKELNILKKETQFQIDYFKTSIRASNNEFSKIWRQETLDKWILKKKKILNTLKFHDSFGTDSKLNIEKAKSYPIEQLIEFDRGGFARCLWHEEKSPSLKWYPSRNKAHCFAGCGDFDSIDVFQKINNLSFKEAVNNLCQNYQ